MADSARRVPAARAHLLGHDDRRRTGPGRPGTRGTASSTPPRARAASASPSRRPSAAAIGTGHAARLAVSGDGGAMYSIAELATARQHDADVTWLIVDDGGYGILREYMTDAFGQATATELTRPDFVALAASFGVPAHEATLEDVGEAIARHVHDARTRRRGRARTCCACSRRPTCSDRGATMGKTTWTSPSS